MITNTYNSKNYIQERMSGLSGMSGMSGMGGMGWGGGMEAAAAPPRAPAALPP